MKSVRQTLRLAAIAMGLAALALAPYATKKVHAAPNGALLTGTIQSASGGNLGGVTVSAKMAGRNITTTVFTDEKGNYFFPAMDAGKYQVWAQADTFETARADVDLTATLHQNFTLKPLQDFERQLTGDQILASLPEATPEDRRMKRLFRNTCTSCHQPNYILQNRFDADGWIAIMNAMRDFTVSGNYNGEDSPPQPIIEYFKPELAAYLAKVRGPGPTAMNFKVRPRPTGEAARVVFTEYDVPLDQSIGYDTQYPTNNGSDWSLGTPSALNGSHGVHDAQADFNGNIWYSNNVASRAISVGRIDAKTGEVRYIKIPDARSNAAVGHGIVRDAQGILWFNINMNGTAQNALGRLDPVTEKVEVFTTPKGMTPPTQVATSIDVDGKGKVWVTSGTGALRFDPETRQFTEFKSKSYITPDGEGMTYGLTGDSQGNGWWGEMNVDIVGHSDIETGKSMEVRLPPVPGQKEMYSPEQQKVFSMSGSTFDAGVPWSEGPRRMGADKTGDTVWVCDWWGGNLAKIDIRTEKASIVPLPNPETQQPYQAQVDSRHNVWTNLMNADEVLRFDPSTSKWTEFQLPTLGAETRYFSLLERNGSMQVIMPYSRTRKVARMTFRSPEELQALKKQVEERQQARAR
ncbi:MAG: carboxypeptidase regulatory-like domain-containing protein [Acidobacteriia bacterium]|nr:carboxypeptidase regulatory-like domain-containing protein [Terriglobia bacterium]